MTRNRYAPIKDEESHGSTNRRAMEHQRRLRRISRAALLTLVSIGACFVVLYFTHWGWPLPHTPALSLEELRNGTYTPHLQPISWLPEGTNGQIILRKHEGFELVNWGDAESAKTIANLTLENSKGDETNVHHLKLNAKQTHAILYVDLVKNWRHSTFSEVHILNLATHESQLLSDSVSVAEWSPNGHSIAYVYEHNVYVYNLDSKKTVQVTHDGGADVFNGIPDWVYEEEVFSGDSAIWWSNSGSTLAYLRTNDSLVPKFPIPYFVQEAPKENGISTAYPEIEELKYPKPGYANPIVDLWLYNVEKKENKLLQIDSKLEDPIISEVIWVGESVVAKLMNREADFLEVWVADTSITTKASLTRHYESKELGGSWFEVTHNAHAVGSKGYIDTIDVDGYNHLGFFSPANASTPTILTSGEWEVDDSAIAVNTDSRYVYFTGTRRSSRQSTLYRVSLDKPNEGFEEVGFEGDGVYSVQFSGDTTFATVYYTSPEAPTVQKIIKLSNPNQFHEWKLEDNSHLKELLHSRGLVVDLDSSDSSNEESLVQYGEITLGNNVTVNYREIRPTRFSKFHKYPVLFYNYGGPGSQMVQEKLAIDFQRVYAEEHNAIVVTIDPRGTGKRGRKFRSAVRDHLGDFEAEDVIEAAKLWNKKHYVKSDKTALWGWSYGGYLTLKVLERDTDLAFKYGVAVAPVTDWALYDSIYTERYMHRPSNNAEGYSHCAIQNVTNMARHDRFLIMHGTGDDNVHLQHTLTLLDKFDLANVENYDMHVFPDSDHSILHHNANNIVFDKVSSWLRKNAN